MLMPISNSINQELPIVRLLPSSNLSTRVEAANFYYLAPQKLLRTYQRSSCTFSRAVSWPALGRYKYNLNKTKLAPPSDGNSSLPVSPNGLVENSLSFAFSKVAPTQLNGGTVKIVDSRTFPVSTAIAAADIFLEPGAIR